MGQPHLLWLTENYHPGRGGMAQSCDRIVHALRELDLTVDLVHFSHHLDAPRVESKRQGRYIGYPLGDDPAHGLNSLWNLIEADPEREKMTHVVAFGGMLPLLAGPTFAAWLGLPLVTLLRGNDFDTAIFSPKRSDILHRAIEGSRMVCAVSRDKERKVRGLHPQAPVTWIPNGIDLEQWEPLPSDLQRGVAWRDEHVEPGRRVLGMFGHIKPKKGGLFFLQALLESGYAERFHLFFVGDIDEEVLLWLDLNHETIHHTLSPFVDRYELLSYYSACDLMVVPSFYDGLPNVVLEGGALGIPFIASTAGGMGDLLADGDHGYLFHPGDRHGCRYAISLAAAATDDELRRLGAECRLVVRGRYDHLSEAERYRDIFHATMQGAISNPPRNGNHTAVPLTPSDLIGDHP
jgi:glycosyltransferase involved in cell wall biosynthesis